MTDLSKQLLEKAHGGPKINPDEQRRYLGTFEERVLGYADIDTANSPQLEKGFLSILENLQAKRRRSMLFRHNGSLTISFFSFFQVENLLVKFDSW